MLKINKLEEDKKDVRKFLTDDEFSAFTEKLKKSYYEAAKLIPELDSKIIAITEEQANELQLKFICHTWFPFTGAVEKLGASISKCVDKNHSYLT